MSLFGKLLFAVVAIVVVVFAVANRERVVLDLWPLPFEMAAPLAWVVILALVVGVLVGAMLMWFYERRWRRRARASERRAAALERDRERRARDAALTPDSRRRLALEDE